MLYQWHEGKLEIIWGKDEFKVFLKVWKSSVVLSMNNVRYGTNKPASHSTNLRGKGYFEQFTDYRSVHRECSTVVLNQIVAFIRFVKVNAKCKNAKCYAGTNGYRLSRLESSKWIWMGRLTGYCTGVVSNKSNL